MSSRACSAARRRTSAPSNAVSKVIRLAVAFALLLPAAYPQTQTAQRSESILDTVSKWLEQLGEKTEFIAPRGTPLGNLAEDLFTDKVTRKRFFDEAHPLRASALVFLANQFGAVHVETWDSPVARVRANITVGAESADVADEVLKAVNVSITETADGIDIRCIEPPTKDLGEVAIAVDFVLTLPPGANLACQNVFGDTHIENMTGNVYVDAQFGSVALRDLSGAVKVHAQGGGEFEVKAEGLRNGGTFKLNRAQADLRRVSGELVVNSVMAPVMLRDLGPEVDALVSNESAPVHVYVNSGEPYIEAATIFGSVQSDIPMERPVVRGSHVTLARTPNRESAQRVRVSTTMGGVFIHQEGMPAPAGPVAEEQRAEAVSATSEDTLRVKEGTPVIIDAVAGDIRVEGIDEDRLLLKVVKRMRLREPRNAEAVRKGLTVSTQQQDGALRIVTHARDGLDTLGCAYYQVDLEIQCPRTGSLEINASRGQTRVSGLGGPVKVRQTEGNVLVEHVKGTVGIVNEKGGAEVRECGGPVTIKATGGKIVTTQVRDRQDIECTQGQTVVDVPHGPVEVRALQGDVRVIALEGIHGDCELRAEQGDLSLLLPSSADATLNISATNGVVYSSSVVLEFGSIRQNVRTYQGKLNKGKHKVVLETRHGDITID